MKQKYFLGDHVYIGDMPKSMSHFKHHCEAIVMYTYAEKYHDWDDRNRKQYCVYLLPKGGEVSWYDEDQLKLLGSDRFDLLPKKHIARVNWESKKERNNV